MERTLVVFKFSLLDIGKVTLNQSSRVSESIRVFTGKFALVNPEALTQGMEKCGALSHSGSF